MRERDVNFRMTSVFMCHVCVMPCNYVDGWNVRLIVISSFNLKYVVRIIFWN